MINHARTLLLNASGGTQVGVLGEEYVPPTYSRMSLPTPLENIRRVLFGSSSDRVLLNYKLRQYMQLIHSTELGIYASLLDPRITYSFTNSDLFDLDTSVAVTQVAGDSEVALLVFGDYSAESNTTVQNLKWSVSVDGEDLIIRQISPAKSETTTPFEIVDGFSEPVTLPGTNLEVRLYVTTPGPSAEDKRRSILMSMPLASSIDLSRRRMSVMNYAGMGISLDGCSWRVSLPIRPKTDLSDTYIGLKTVGDDNIAYLFKNGANEPFKTFKNLWDKEDKLPYAMSALLLAYVYNLNSLRST